MNLSQAIAKEEKIFISSPVNPVLEMGAYEHLWSQPGATFKRLSDFFRENSDSLPSELVGYENSKEASQRVLDHFDVSGIKHFGLRLNGTSQYPVRLRDAANPVELLYYLGTWELTDTENSVAIVGSRKPSDEGIRRARKLASLLSLSGYTIVSGLAEGIDTAAHQGALSVDGKTIAVIGTPISQNYPLSNRELQKKIANEHLLISQVPVLRYLQQDYRNNRNFFPERNKTMSALTKATIIVEASDTSGTLTQARAALAQGRKLIILENCFHNKSITWPERFLAKGAHRVEDFDKIVEVLTLD